MAVAPFADVYEAHAPAVYRYCLARLGDPCAAEEAAAETFSSAYAAWDGFTDEDPTGVRRWIFTIARNAAVDQHRRRRRGLSLLGRLRPAGGDGGASSTDVETVAQLRAELRAALAAVGDLGRRDRELVGLRVAAGLSFAEIAALLGISEQAARTATRRALVKVRTALEATER